jgi:hypothetical protein
MEIQIIEYFSGAKLDDQFEREWSSLFAYCYKSTEEKAKALFRKYRLNESRFCILRYEGRMVACYSGLKLPFHKSYIFLSTDTMSDGTIGGASIILGKHIYNLLTEEGVFAVCGFPNEQIRAIRQKRLGWTIAGSMNFYISFPVLCKFFIINKKENLWKVIRPKGGYFSKAIPCVNLFCNGKIYSNRFGLIATLSAYKPGLFFFRIPYLIVPPKLFGYKLLVDDSEILSVMNNATLNLDLETIDVP